MEPIIISIINAIGDDFAVEAEDGEKVYLLIKKAFDAGQKVKVSFLNIKMLTTAFLNTAIGQLYRDYTEEVIRQRILIDDMNNAGKVALKRVIDTAKIFYSNPDALKDTFNDK